MANRLFVRPELPLSASDTFFEWGLYDASGSQLSYATNDTLEEIIHTLEQNDISNVEIIGLLPASLGQYCEVNMPGKQARYIEQALPFVIEDQIAQDIETVHLSTGSKTKDGTFPTVVVDQSIMSEFYDLLTDDAIPYPLAAIYIDAALLPIQDNNIVVFLGDETATLKKGNGFTLGLTQSNLLPFLDLVLENKEDELEAQSLKVYIPEALFEQNQILLAELDQYPNLTIDTETLNISLFQLLCESYFQQQIRPVNLCHGQFKAGGENGGEFRKWRSVAIVAGIWFLVQIGIFIGKGLYFEQQADLVNQQALSEYQKIFPRETKTTVYKLRRVLAGKLKQNQQTGSQNSFLQLIGEAGYHYAQSKNRNNMKFTSLNFSEQRGELVIELQADSFDQLDQLKNSIVASGLTAKISSAVKESNHFKGRISVSGS